MGVGDPPERAGQLIGVGVGAGDPAHEQRDESVALGANGLRLGERLPHDPAAPQGEPAGDRRRRLDELAHPLDRELGVTRVGEHLEHQHSGRWIEQLRDLAVEVGRDAVADIRLDQALRPVGRRGLRVKSLKRDDEGRHRLLRGDPHAVEVAFDQPVVAEFGGGKLGERRLVFEGRRHPRVVSEPLEGDQLGVGEDAEQVSDGVAVDRVAEQVGLLAHEVAA